MTTLYNTPWRIVDPNKNSGVNYRPIFIEDNKGAHLFHVGNSKEKLPLAEFIIMVINDYANKERMK